MTAERPLGFVGLGNIGGAVCANLLADGHRVHVHDVDPVRVAELEAVGAVAASSPAEVGARAGWTFLSLPGPDVMASVAADWLAGARTAGDGKILVDLTTNAPTTVRSVGTTVQAAGAQLVEAPVTGGAVGARNRRLLFITGGDEEVLAPVRPLLLTVGRGVCHMGPLGAGNVGKLVNSLLAFSTMWASLEALALAAKHGVDLRTVVDMVRTSGGATPYLDRRVEEITERGRPTEFAMELAAKDAGLMLEAGRQVGVPMPLAAALHQVLTYAKAQGLAGRDISDLVEVMEHAAAVHLDLRPAEPAPQPG